MEGFIKYIDLKNIPEFESPFGILKKCSRSNKRMIISRNFTSVSMTIDILG